MEIYFQLMAGLAALSVGAALTAWGFAALRRVEAREARESLLAPVLMVDALDPDLKVLYARSMVLDAIWAGRKGHTRGPVGRELRRYLVDLQAARVAIGDAVQVDPEVRTGVELIETESNDNAWNSLMKTLRGARRRVREETVVAGAPEPRAAAERKSIQSIS